jgi:tetratricopeptide (TPR) repeat protein
LAHMTHMPSHIDIRCGRWQPAVVACEQAIAADAAYRKLVTPPGFYWILMAHNHHMLAYAAAMQGESHKAKQAIQDMIATYFSGEIPKRYPAMVDGFFAMPYEIDLRFGRWDEMLAEPPPPGPFPIATALWHFARGVAFAAKNRVEEAKVEAAVFAVAKRAVPDGLTFRFTPAAELLDVAENMLAGEILYREGKINEAVAAFKLAIQREDSLPYSEPPDWFQPVRHALAAVLNEAGRSAEAEAVCRQDLAHHPENGWSLFGLSQSLRKQKKVAEANAVTARFNEVWKHADFKLTASCLCVPGKG